MGSLMKSSDHINRLNETHIINKIIDLAKESPICNNRRYLLHAYIACLDLSELCSVVHDSLEAPSLVRRALRQRLVRVIKEAECSLDTSILVELVEKNFQSSISSTKKRKTSDTILSYIFAFLPLHTQQLVLDRWLDRGNKETMARWMKAVKGTTLFDTNIVFSYWKSTGDWRAAKLLAYESDIDSLRKILPDLIAECAEGWIIAKAVIRAGPTYVTCWTKIAESHPATYLYLCARLATPVTDEQAFELVFRCSDAAFGGDRGLAIWAVGQLGKIAVLDRINASLSELEEADSSAFRVHLAAQ